jgi:Family of unknown function (DUF5336)
MTYSTGGPGYPPAQPNPYASTNTPTSQFAKPEPGPSNWPAYLLGAVIALGLIGYLVSFGPNIPNDSLVTVALVLAGLLAAIDLVPKQRDYTGVVVVIASIGFLLAISHMIKGSGGGWAWITTVALTVLQALAAAGALLLEAGVITPPAPRPKYEQYPPYGAAGQYYGQPAQPQQQYTQPPGYPYGGYPGGPMTGAYPPPPQPGPPTPPTGFPTYSQPPAPAQAPQAGQGPEDHQPQPQDSSAQSAPPPG